MKFYFKTIVNVLQRLLRDNGVPTWLGVFLFLLVMVLLTALTNRYPEYAPYLIIYLAMSGLLAIQSKVRMDFLQQQFGLKRARQIRCMENLVITLPSLYLAFILVNWYLILFLLLLVLLTAYMMPKLSRRSIPTPFTKSPFEVIIFLRRSFVYVLLIAYALTGIACYYGNFNLGLVCMSLVLLIGCSAQDFREPPYFIWLYDADPTRFLKMKVIRATTQMTLLILPMAVLLIMVFPAQFLPVFLCLLVGLLFHVLFVLLKYAVYPRIFTVPDLILLMFGFALPVIFPFIIYRFYHKAKNNLSQWL